ncbi:MAG: hypothetical protein Q7T20_16950 [Saprospiraceae bacterium]|nr:hypothetical protein [Saprospiraceae bacterium]
MFSEQPSFTSKVLANNSISSLQEIITVVGLRMNFTCLRYENEEKKSK